MRANTTLFDVADAAVRAHVGFLATPHTEWRDLRFFVVPWAVQFVCSWVAFLLYMRLDYAHFVADTLHAKGDGATKLPTRHPLIPFWWSQLRMVPLVLFNQLVVWPLVSLLVVWPIWARSAAVAASTRGDGAAATALLVGTAVACFTASDVMWYWCHRMLHVRACCGVRVWRDCHRDHHMAEQAALSATYVAPFEYALFTLSTQLWFALAGFPLLPVAIALGWGMFTGSGAHSGYSGGLANGDEHNAHHVWHNVNFGMLMIADRIWGTYWHPAAPLPPTWEGAVDIAAAHPDLYGGFEASVPRREAALAAAAARKGAGGKKMA